MQNENEFIPPQIITYDYYTTYYVLPEVDNVAKQKSLIEKWILQCQDQIDTLCGNRVYDEYANLDLTKEKDKKRLYYLQKAICSLLEYYIDTGKAFVDKNFSSASNVPANINASSEDANFEHKRKDIIKMLVAGDWYQTFNTYTNAMDLNCDRKQPSDDFSWGDLIDRLSEVFKRVDNKNSFIGKVIFNDYDLDYCGNITGYKPNRQNKISNFTIENCIVPGYQFELVEGNYIDIDYTDPVAPIISADIEVSNSGSSVTDISYLRLGNNWYRIATALQIQSDWNQTDPNASDYIKNKPTNLVTTDTEQTITGHKTFNDTEEETSAWLLGGGGWVVKDNTNNHQIALGAVNGSIGYTEDGTNVYYSQLQKQNGTIALMDETVQNQHTTGYIVRDKLTATATTQTRAEIKPNGYVLYDSTTNGLTQYGVGGITYYVNGHSYSLTYPQKSGALLTTDDLSTQLANYYTKTECDENYVYKNTDNLVNQTCDDLLAFVQDPGKTIVFTDIQFTTAESPDEETETRWECEVHRNNISSEGPSAYIIAKSCSGIYKNNYYNENWQGWEKYATQNWVDFYYYNKNWIQSNYYIKSECDSTFLKLAGGNMTGPITHATTGGVALVKGYDNSTNNAIAYGGTSYDNGSSIWLSGKNVNNGGFGIDAYNGTNRKSLIGSATGSLTWDGKNVITSDYTITKPNANTTYIQNNQTYYFKCGKVVQVNVSMKTQAVSLSGEPILLTGLPIPIGNMNTYFPCYANTALYACWVDSDGNLRGNNIPKTSTGAEWIRGTITYITSN